MNGVNLIAALCRDFMFALSLTVAILAALSGFLKSNFVRLRLDVRTALDERLHCVQVPVDRGPHQRRLLTGGLGGVDVRAVAEQDLDDVGGAGARRGHQRGHAAVGGAFDIGPGLEETFDDSRVTADAGERQWRDAVAIAGVRMCSCRQERIDQVEGAAIRGIVQRRGPVGLLRIDVHARLEERADGVEVAVRGGLRDRRSLRGRRVGCGRERKRDRERD
jgi:hypothetical protein